MVIKLERKFKNRKKTVDKMDDIILMPLPDGDNIGKTKVNSEIETYGYRGYLSRKMERRIHNAKRDGVWPYEGTPRVVY